MNTDHIVTKSVPSPEELQFLEDRLYEFNSAKIGKDDGQLFAFFIRNDQQEIMAVAKKDHLATYRRRI